MTAAAFPKRFSAIPNKFSADGNKRSSTVKPVSNPFSFNSYAFRPAPQPSAPQLPFDPADLTRRLERYLASLEPGSDAAAPPARPSAISRQASSSSTAAASSGRNGANQPLLNPRTKSATASAHSPASPNTGTAASPSKKSSHAALNNGNTALLASSRAVAEPLPYATAPRSNENLATLEALRQEARRATRRSLALHASKGLNAPVAAGELAKRLNALTGSGIANPASNSDPLLARKSSSPVMRNGDVKRSSSARANEKRVRAPGADLRKSSSMLLATLELELEKMRIKEAHGSRRSMRRSMPVAGADADQLWRVYVSTQRGTNTQAMVAERQQKSVRKSASARRAKTNNTTELDLMRGSGGKILQKSRSTGCVEGSDGTQANGELGKSGEHVLGRRPDWSQRDEMDKLSLHHPLHLHVPGLGRSSLTTEVRSGDDRGVASHGERKMMTRTPEMKTSYRQSVCIADVSKRTSSSAAAPARRGPPQLPALLHIPSLHSSDDIITIQQATSSSSPLSPTTIPSPSITLSPVDSSDTIPMHPGFGPTSSSTNPLVSMRTSSSPTLPPLRHSPSFEARIPQHLFYPSADGQLHGQQSPHHHSFPSKASGKAAVALAPLPEISPLPAPDRFSKKRPSMPPRQKSSSTTVTTTSTGQRSTSTTRTTATAYATRNKARGQHEYGTVMSPVSASTPSSVPWPGPSQGRGARVMVGGGVGRPAQHQYQQHQRGVVREERSQSAMEVRGVKEYSNGGSNNKTVGRRKSVAFVSTSYPASASAGTPGRGVGPQGRETSSGGPTTGIQRSSTLPVKGKVGEEKDTEGHSAKNSTRLVFWRRDSGKVVDEAMLSGGEEHHVLRSPSRLAFWKKGK